MALTNITHSSAIPTPRDLVRRELILLARRQRQALILADGLLALDDVAGARNVLQAAATGQAVL